MRRGCTQNQKCEGCHLAAMLETAIELNRQLEDWLNERIALEKAKAKKTMLDLQNQLN